MESIRRARRRRLRRALHAQTPLCEAVQAIVLDCIEEQFTAIKMEHTPRG